MIVNQETGTCMDEVAVGIYRDCTPLDVIRRTTSASHSATSIHTDFMCNGEAARYTSGYQTRTMARRRSAQRT